MQSFILLLNGLIFCIFLREKKRSIYEIVEWADSCKIERILTVPSR